MAINHERYLLSKILDTGDLLSVGDSGVTPQYFHDPESRRVFETILRYKSEYGECPTPRMLQDNFPTYKFVKVNEPIQYLLDVLQHRHARGVFEQALTAAVDQWTADDLDAVRATLRGVLTETADDTQRSRDTDITQTVNERLERYDALKHLDGGLLGLPSGFATIDRATGGFQNKQLIFMVGPPKAGKSTTMLLAAMEAWAKGYRPLLIGFEMTNEEQEQRIDAIFAHVSHHRLRNGTLTAEEWKALRRNMRSMESMKSFVLSNDTMSTTTLSGIEAKVERYDPDLLLVDGVYMMDDENGEKKNSSQALTNITRGLKRLSQNCDLPVVATTQVLESKMDAKRGITSNSIGYSSSFGQDADALIGVENTDDEHIKKVKIIHGRNVGATETYIQWDWEKGDFTELAEDPFSEAAQDYEVKF